MGGGQRLAPTGTISERRELIPVVEGGLPCGWLYGQWSWGKHQTLDGDGTGI